MNHFTVLRSIRVGISCAVICAAMCGTAVAGAVQDGVDSSPPDASNPNANNTPSAPTAPVTVQPVTRDNDIRARIERILEATGEYSNTVVSVKQGVVFLQGQAKSDHLKQWAGETAGKVQDVVAVFNGLEVLPPSPWDFSSTIIGLQDLWRGVLGSLPVVLFGLLTLCLTWIASMFATHVLQRFMRKGVTSPLLRDVLARFGGFLVLLIGIYIILQVAGLARLALTVLGGTGLLGLGIGIAFRDITENLLSSIFLSVQRPFRTGDLVDVAGTLGYVEQLNSRNTVLMTLDGNLVQIPNATVYKSILRNYSSNPNRREDFVVGIGYEALVPDAQDIAMKVLSEHPAVLNDPEPWVLVDNFGKATVDLRVYFWLDGSKHSWLKVKSSVMRLVKRAFQESGISIPDEGREVKFLNELEIRWHGRPTVPKEFAREQRIEVGPEAAVASQAETAAIATAAEGGLQSEAINIEEQARLSRPAEETNLLSPESEKAD